jgi:hypothetical protein
MSSAGMNGAVSSTAFFPPSACPPCASTADGADAADQQSTRARHQRGPLPPELWENGEAATIIQAATSAGAEVAAAQPEIDSALRRLAERVAEADAAVGELVMFAIGHRLGDAQKAMRGLVARHAQDGPEDRRRQPRWVRWLTWPTVIAAAGYDTWFFSGVFRSLLDASTRPTDPGLYLSLLPGVMITVALLVTAHWIAQAAGRANDHVERRPSWVRWWSRLAGWLRRRPPNALSRTADNLPWPRWWRASVFGGFTIVTLGL